MDTSDDIPTSTTNEEDPQLDQVCEKLDQLLLRQLELIQEYVDLSLKGELYQKEGYLNLAKARYIEGPNSMSIIRLPTQESEEYNAVIKVTTTTEDREPIATRTLNQSTPDSQDNNKLLRQFGLLSPSSVKLAQKSFRENLALCMDRVNVMEELGHVQKQFYSLQCIKQQLLSEITKP